MFDDEPQTNPFEKPAETLTGDDARMMRLAVVQGVANSAMEGALDFSKKMDASGGVLVAGLVTAAGKAVAVLSEPGQVEAAIENAVVVLRETAKSFAEQHANDPLAKLRDLLTKAAAEANDA